MSEDVPQPFWHKGSVSNLLSLLTLLFGLTVVMRLLGEPSPWLADLGPWIMAAGVFGFAGGITNWLAVKMLFDRVPGLYGSGVVSARFRLHEAGVGLDVVDQPLLVLAELEIVVVLHQLGDFAVDRVERSVVAPVLLGQECLLLRRVKAAIFGLIKMSVVMELLQHRLHERLVARGGGADKIRIGQVQPRGERLPDRGELIAVHLRILALGRGRGLHLLAVFIEAGEVKHLLPQATMRPSDDVGDDFLIGVPKVRFPVDVIDGRGEVKLFTHPWPSMRL